MTFAHKKDGERRRKSTPLIENAMSERPLRKKKRPESPEVGAALRTVYQRTIEEDIPPEMLDLLGKLG